MLHVINKKGMADKGKRCWSLLTWQPWSRVQFDYWKAAWRCTVDCDHCWGNPGYNYTLGSDRSVSAGSGCPTVHRNNIHSLYTHCSQDVWMFILSKFIVAFLPRHRVKAKLWMINSIQLHKCSVAITLSQSDLQTIATVPRCSVFPPSPPRHLLCEELIS